jgi:hypothetical protein
MFDTTPGEDDKILYIVSLDPDAGYEDDFNRWYNTEHIPELLACPGFEAAARFEQIEAKLETSPRFLAMYRTSSMDAFTSDQYRSLHRRSEAELGPLNVEVHKHVTRRITAKYKRIFVAQSDDSDT